MNAQYVAPEPYLTSSQPYPYPQGAQPWANQASINKLSNSTNTN